MLRLKFSPQTSGTSLNRAVCTSNHNEPCGVLLSAAARGDVLMRWNSKNGSGIHAKTAEAFFCLRPAQKCRLLRSQSADWFGHYQAFSEMGFFDFASKLSGSVTRLV